MFILGIILIIAGYFLLFNVSSNATVETVMNQAIAGMGLSIAGAIFLMIYIYKRT